MTAFGETASASHAKAVSHRFVPDHNAGPRLRNPGACDTRALCCRPGEGLHSLGPGLGPLIRIIGLGARGRFVTLRKPFAAAFDRGCGQWARILCDSFAKPRTPATIASGVDGRKPPHVSFRMRRGFQSPHDPASVRAHHLQTIFAAQRGLSSCRGVQLCR